MRGIVEAKCIVVTAVCVSVCLSLAALPYYWLDPDISWGNGTGCRRVVEGRFGIGARVSLLWQYSAEREMSASASTCSVLGLVRVGDFVSFSAMTRLVDRKGILKNPVSLIPLSPEVLFQNGWRRKTGGTGWPRFMVYVEKWWSVILIILGILGVMWLPLASSGAVSTVST